MMKVATTCCQVAFLRNITYAIRKIKLKSRILDIGDNKSDNKKQQRRILNV